MKRKKSKQENIMSRLITEDYILFHINFVLLRTNEDRHVINQ